MSIICLVCTANTFYNFPLPNILEMFQEFLVTSMEFLGILSSYLVRELSVRA